MSLQERCKRFATRNYVNSDGEVVATIVDEQAYQNALVVATTVKKEMIEKACKCFCDNICEQNMSAMCFFKHDGQGQVRNSFGYNECNELRLMRHEMEE